ncbi:hypothetical protein PoB_004593500 [Plakobranchus ocellatus]|uniref:Uncharacterized protein n=1 Tax=Plakobranchus ocellatus TaxID=259542 RepID=A0AAV4BIU9_9GAST|nr:hypothetical protein PoB_004593500 [Plakobranchus ocellatus]
MHDWPTVHEMLLVVRLHVRDFFFFWQPSSIPAPPTTLTQMFASNPLYALAAEEKVEQETSDEVQDEQKQAEVENDQPDIKDTTEDQNSEKQGQAEEKKEEVKDSGTKQVEKGSV